MNPFRRPRFRRTLPALFAFALGLALVGSLGAGCDPNAVTPLLVATGGGDDGGNCTSTFNTIQMVGDFTSPAFSIPASPQMVEDASGCIWRVSVNLTAGTVLFKFVTDGAFDSPQDYGGSETVTLTVPGGPHDTQLVSGTGTAIKVTVATTGAYTITLNERTLTWSATPGAPPPGGGIAGTASFANLVSAPFPLARVTAFNGLTEVGSATTDPATRAFSIGGLAAGTYRLVATASCFTTVELPSVTVSSGATNVGNLALSEGASAFTTIDLVGGFNLFSPGVDPMVQSAPCVWTRDRSLAGAVFVMKFLTDGSFDTPLDYGGDELTTTDVPGSGTVRPVSGPGTGIRISVANAGTYRFILDERLQRWEIQAVPPAPSGEDRR